MACRRRIVVMSPSTVGGIIIHVRKPGIESGGGGTGPALFSKIPISEGYGIKRMYHQ